MGNSLSFVQPRTVLPCIIVGRVISMNIVRAATRPALFAAAAGLAAGIAGAAVIAIVIFGIAVTTAVAVATASTVGIVGAVAVASVVWPSASLEARTFWRALSSANFCPGVLV
ncbi:hypothetical protein NHJ13734_009539 [Beauveria thailandica]